MEKRLYILIAVPMVRYWEFRDAALWADMTGTIRWRAVVRAYWQWAAAVWG